MKKATLIFVMFFGTLLLTSCTDTSKELEERTEIENEIKLIDKENSVNPNSSGNDEEPSNEEE